MFFLHNVINNCRFWQLTFCRYVDEDEILQACFSGGYQNRKNRFISELSIWHRNLQMLARSDWDLRIDNFQSRWLVFWSTALNFKFVSCCSVGDGNTETTIYDDSVNFSFAKNKNRQAAKEITSIPSKANLLIYSAINKVKFGRFISFLIFCFYSLISSIILLARFSIIRFFEFKCIVPDFHLQLYNKHKCSQP